MSYLLPFWERRPCAPTCERQGSSNPKAQAPKDKEPERRGQHHRDKNKDKGFTKISKYWC